ncbi:unnamed protein product [Rotaria sordida]|uniref:Uncharacterized protein n=1 Tax=Rotaria sordida TaxID=392033 RepID=A0A818ZBP4_9BILA|nr:unnamed protein product [Rotaria sordida]CAF3766984.1 unnamed protein product [Rotaria sordida]
MVLGAVDNVFVYPTLDIKQLQNAIGRTISLWPIVVGRLCITDNEHYSIELSDNPIPFTYVENDELERWPILPVAIDDRTILQSFVDSVPSEPTQDDPLVRFKVTRLVRSNEYVLGVSFYHMLGDADSYIHFLSDLSRFYQGLEPLSPKPSFERHLWIKKDAPRAIDSSLMPLLQPLQDARPRDIIIAKVVEEHTTTDPVQISFSSEQLTKLHSLAGQGIESITIQDALTAYIIVTLNKYVLVSDNEHIRRTNTIINYRGISDTLAPRGQVDNSIMFMLSDDFDNPLSLQCVAKTIRASINKARNEEFLERWLITIDLMMRKIHKEGKAWNFASYPNEIWFNSNLKYDWASKVDLGMKDQCRFHTVGVSKLKCRVFPLNPIQDVDGNWTRDHGGAEVSFRIPKEDCKNKFIAAWNNDVKENFMNFKILE